MAFNASYDTTDITEATVDGVGKFIITAGGFAGLIALVVLLVLGIRYWKKR